MTDPVRAAELPFVVDVQAGKTYYWCACGRSKSQPFCDGSHKGSGFEPLAYQATRNQKVFFCGCKASRKAPLCDGSHNRSKA